MRKQFIGLAAAFGAMMMASMASWAANDAGIILAASDATAKDAAGASRKLDRRSPINVGDTLVTGAAGKVQMRMKDGTVLALGEGSEFLVDSYTTKASGDAKDSATLKLVKGTLMQVSGNMEKSAYSLETPVSTLGIRGTVFNIKINADGTVSATVSAGTVVSAAGAAVQAAQTKLASAKVKAKRAKALYEEAVADGLPSAELAKLKSAMDDAATEMATEQTATDTAVANALTEINGGESTKTGPDGTSVPTEFVNFDSVTPEQLIKLVGDNNKADLAPLIAELSKADPGKANDYADLGKTIAPELGPEIDAAAEEGVAASDPAPAPDNNPITNTDDSGTAGEGTPAPGAGVSAPPAP